MRLPNGFGSVSKMSGKRAAQYMVRKSTGVNKNGVQTYKIIGYTSTREDGITLLAEYNKNPWNTDDQSMSMSDLFGLWDKTKSDKYQLGTVKALRSAFKHCAEIHNTPYKNIKAFHMQRVIDNFDSPSTQAKLKNLFTNLDKLALELDIPIKGYAQLLTTAPLPPSDRQPFTEAEIQTVWAHQAEPWVDSILVLLYGGWRISELLALRKVDINLIERTMRGGMKTEAGKNRIVPIHHRIFPLIAARMLEPGDRVFPGSLTCFRKRWNRFMADWGMDHIPHECRHTFRTRLEAAGANQKCCDLLMGHASKDVGNRVYNHKTIEELRDAIELLP